MVCTPMGRDQYAVSGCVERLGLGRVASMTVSPEELRQMLVAALEDDVLHARTSLLPGWMSKPGCPERSKCWRHCRSPGGKAIQA
jgi:UDP:flavonoid glycosyltransferase YjiC (YdhE family)